MNNDITYSCFVTVYNGEVCFCINAEDFKGNKAKSDLYYLHQFYDTLILRICEGLKEDLYIRRTPNLITLIDGVYRNNDLPAYMAHLEQAMEHAKELLQNG